MPGGLFDPLGTDRAEPARARPALLVVAGVAAIALAALLAVSALRDDGDRGRPVVVAPIEHVVAPPAPPPTAAPPTPPAPGPTAPSGLPPVQADQDVEIQNGVRIIRPRRSAPGPAGETLPVPLPPPGSPRR